MEPKRLSSLPAAEVTDNPCWGGPKKEQHDLPYLLSLIENARQTKKQQYEKQESENDGNAPPLVVYESESYIALNKPPDLRMDGPHPSTVHKMLTYWYPPPSLLPLQKEIFLSDIAKLSKYNDLKDNELRPTHQLDYATSGLLLVARSKHAASVACKSFHDRLTSKTYIALVHGCMDATNYPILENEQQYQQFWDNTGDGVGEMEKRYKQLKKKKDKKEQRKNQGKGNLDTFEGYMPPHSVFAKWKGLMIRQRKKKEKQKDEMNNKCDGTSDSSRNESANNPSINGDGKHCEKNDKIYEKEPKRKRTKTTTNYTKQKKNQFTLKQEKILSTPIPSLSEEEITTLLQITKYSQVARNKKWVDLFNNLSLRYNEATKLEQQEEGAVSLHNESKMTNEKSKAAASVSTKPLPCLFRLPSCQNKKNEFYINASIASPPQSSDDDFKMYLDPKSLHSKECCIPSKYHSHYTKNTSLDNDLDYKPALTRCEILWSGRVRKPTDEQNSDNNTEEEMWDTLVTKVKLYPRTGRRHQLRLHMAIAGHPIVGDATYEYPSCSKQPSLNRQTKENEFMINRMCLHSFSLSIPLMDGLTHAFEAPDPFQIVSVDGEGNSRKEKVGVDCGDEVEEELVVMGPEGGII